jgi:hypothetical protein
MRIKLNYFLLKTILSSKKVSNDNIEPRNHKKIATLFQGVANKKYPV